MSLHTAVLITAETCGHCKSMRGSGRLLSQNEIKKDKKPPSIPGGFHYDAKYFRRVLTGKDKPDNKSKPVVRLINVHYNSMNPMQGIKDISVFLIENESSIRQIILKEEEGKTSVEIYVIGEVGKLISKNLSNTVWSDSVKLYVPINIAAYVRHFPTISLFHADAWENSIRNGKPIYGVVNGLETNPEVPYGFVPLPRGVNPNVIDFAKFIGQYLDDEHKEKELNPIAPPVPPKPEDSKDSNHSTGSNTSGTSGTAIKFVGNELCRKIKYRLYVKE